MHWLSEALVRAPDDRLYMTLTFWVRWYANTAFDRFQPEKYARAGPVTYCIAVLAVVAMPVVSLPSRVLRVSIDNLSGRFAGGLRVSDQCNGICRARHDVSS